MAGGRDPGTLTPLSKEVISSYWPLPLPSVFFTFFRGQRTGCVGRAETCCLCRCFVAAAQVRRAVSRRTASIPWGLRAGPRLGGVLGDILRQGCIQTPSHCFFLSRRKLAVGAQPVASTDGAHPPGRATDGEGPVLGSHSPVALLSQQWQGEDLSALV